MSKLRAPLHLAVALILLSLTCDIGAVCAAAGMEGECCCMMADGSTPCTDMSDGDEAPGAAEPAATIDGGQRFPVAVLAARFAELSPGAAPSGPDGRLRLSVDAAATPLFLSHCAFLC